MSLYAQESYINRTEGHRFGDSDVYETSSETTGELYRAMRKEYGRCVSRVYIDKKDGGAQAIGWVFVRKDKYTDDPKKTYLREVWVTVHKQKPENKTTHFYANLDE